MNSENGNGCLYTFGQVHESWELSSKILLAKHMHGLSYVCTVPDDFIGLNFSYFTTFCNQTLQFC